MKSVWVDYEAVHSDYITENDPLLYYIRKSTCAFLIMHFLRNSVTNYVWVFYIAGRLNAVNECSFVFLSLLTHDSENTN